MIKVKNFSLTIVIATLMFFGLSLITKSSVFAATCTWTGATDANWSTTTNWTGCGGVAPQNGDDLVFNAGTYPSTNDIAGLTINSVSSNSGLANVDLGTLNLNAGGIVVSSNFPQFTGAITLAASSTIQTVSGSAALQLGGTIDLNTFDLDINAGGSGMNFSSVISGTGNLTKDGNANLNISSNQTYTGTFTINDGTVNSQNTDTIPDATDVTINSPGVLDLNNNSETINSLSGDGTVTLGSGTITIVGGPGPSFSGAINGTGNVVIGGSGGGEVFLGNNGYTGTTTILTNGDLLVNTGTIGSSSSLTVQTGSGLAIATNGTIPNTTFQTGSVFFPGSGGNGIGNSGSLTFTSGVIYGEVLNSTAATSFGNVHVTGTVDLADATLALVGTYVPVGGDKFTMIDNDGTDPVTGTFNGLPEGSIIAFGGGNLMISYVGGTGNDVVLYAVPLATATALNSSANPSTIGQSVTFTATVTTGVGTPTGTVDFKDGATTIGSGTLNGSGVATFSTSSLAIGTHSITAVYNGDPNYLTSTSSPVSQVVNDVLANTGISLPVTTLIIIAIVSGLGTFAFAYKRRK